MTNRHRNARKLATYRVSYRRNARYICEHVWTHCGSTCCGWCEYCGR